MTIQELNNETKQILRHNVSEVIKNINKSKENSRFFKDVTLLAATKTVPAEVINYVTQELGVKNIGENRVQELLEKYDASEDIITSDVDSIISKLKTIGALDE